MKLAVQVLFLLFLCGPASAALIESKIFVSQNESLSPYLHFQCQENDSSCQQLCQNDKECFVAETPCVDCVAHSYNVMQIIFTDLNSIYKPIPVRLGMHQLHSFFRQQRFLSIKADSYLNLYTPEHAVRNQQQFRKFCDLETSIGSDQEPILLLTVDGRQQIQNLVAVICHEGSEAYIRPVDYNPLFSKKAMNFWSNASRVSPILLENRP